MSAKTVTTVITAAKSYDLVALPQVKDDLAVFGNKDDSFLRRTISRESLAAARYCNRVFPVETVQDEIYIEQDPYPYQTPGGVFPLQLSRWPLITVTSVVQITSASTTQALTEGKDFTVDAENGQLVRLNTFTGAATMWEALPVIVQYAAGYTAIPDDIQDAVTRMIKARYSARTRDPYLKSDEVAGIGTQTFWVSAGNTGNMTPDISDILDNYRVPVIV